MHVKNIHCMIEELAEGLKSNVTKSMKPEEVQVLGDTVDMLKDLCEAEYYSRISKAMEESEKEEEEESKYLLRQMKEEYGDEEGERRFYNRNRYSNGRFAPKGRGRSMRMGYMPMPWDEEEYMQDYLQYPRLRNTHWGMGYNDGNRGMEMNGRNSYGESGRGGDNEGSRYGRSYNNYRSAKRHYAETKDPDEQRRMKESIAEVFDDMEEITVDMVRDMTPEEKTKYKQKLQAMMQKIQ